MSKTPAHISHKEFLDYTNNRLSDPERHRMEHHMLDCEFCSEAMEGYELLEDKDDKAIISLNKRLSNRAFAKPDQFGGRQILAIAASIALILGGSYFFFDTLEKRDAEQLAELTIEEKKTTPQKPEFETPQETVFEDLEEVLEKEEEEKIESEIITRTESRVIISTKEVVTKQTLSEKKDLNTSGFADSNDEFFAEETYETEISEQKLIANKEVQIRTEDKEQEVFDAESSLENSTTPVSLDGYIAHEEVPAVMEIAETESDASLVVTQSIIMEEKAKANAEAASRKSESSKAMAKQDNEIALLKSQTEVNAPSAASNESIETKKVKSRAKTSKRKSAAYEDGWTDEIVSATNEEEEVPAYDKSKAGKYTFVNNAYEETYQLKADGTYKLVWTKSSKKDKSNYENGYWTTKGDTLYMQARGEFLFKNNGFYRMKDNKIISNKFFQKK